MQTEMYHLRVDGDASKIIKAQAERCNVSANAMAVALLKAAAAAVEDYDGPLLPPTFALENPPIANHQTKPRR